MSAVAEHLLSLMNRGLQISHYAARITISAEQYYIKRYYIATLKHFLFVIIYLHIYTIRQIY